MLNNKKFLIGLMLYGMLHYAQAEVLVILPESGPMARAGLSIKQGFMSAYQATDQKTVIKFVNSDQKSIAQLLKQNLNKKTKMIVGPLARSEVEALMRAQPKVRVLALNDVVPQAKNVWQFSLSKKDDAYALHQVVQKDQIKQLYIVRQKSTEQDSELFMMALMGQADYPIRVLDEVPSKLPRQSGLLLLGSYDWINGLKKLPKKNLYVLANSIEQNQTLPRGVKFCDTPALYGAIWPDVIQAYQQNPVSMSYQRLLAFGGDVWHITEQYLQQPKLKTIEFQGRTGWIQINDNQIQRTPQCYENSKKGLRML